MDGELHVGTAGIDADFAQHRDGGVAHQLVFLVSQRLRRCHGDGIAGVHTHGSRFSMEQTMMQLSWWSRHHLHLELFPANEALFDEQLVGGREFQTGLQMVSNSSAL